MTAARFVLDVPHPPPPGEVEVAPYRHTNDPLAGQTLDLDAVGFLVHEHGGYQRSEEHEDLGAALAAWTEFGTERATLYQLGTTVGGHEFKRSYTPGQGWGKWEGR